MTKTKPRWRWIALVCLPVLFFVAQCTPVFGCWGESTFAEGRHLGFTVGMDREAASRVVASSYEVGDVSVWYGTNDILFVRKLDQLRSIDASRQQWRFRNRSRNYCAARRNVVLVFREQRLQSIKDELDITLP
jgi:hypothetical protein